MIQKFLLEIVSPEALLFSREVVMVTCPGIEGDFGVLQGHMPFISTLRSGPLHVYENDDRNFETLYVSGGFAEVTNTRCTILAEKVSEQPIAEAA